MADVANDPKPKSDPAPPDPGSSGKPPEEGVITTTVAQLKGLVRDFVDEILGEGDEADDKNGSPAPDSDHPKTDRETEQSLRDQVKSAVAELARDAQHDKEHEELKTPKPPQAEVKPWRHQLWGDRDGD